jgi:HEAT repeat protein
LFKFYRRWYTLYGSPRIRFVEPAINALNDKYYQVRATAAFTLGKLGDKRAISPLVNLLKDRYGYVRYQVVYALGELGDEQLFPILEDIRQHDNKEYENIGTVSSVATKAIELIKQRQVNNHEQLDKKV